MNSFVLALLDPKVLAVVLAAFGSAIGWLVRQVRKNHAAHQQCEIRLARAEEAHKSDRAEVERLAGSVDTLARLVRKEMGLD